MTSSTTEMRVCSYCRQEKPLDTAFYRNRTQAKGRDHRCIECTKRRYRLGDNAMKPSGERARRAANARRVCLVRQAEVETTRKYRAALHEAKGGDQITTLKYRSRYRTDQAFADRERQRRNNNRTFRRDGIAKVIWQAINRRGSDRILVDQLGYSIDELMAHVQSRFTDGMNWRRYRNGEIHIDHIKPFAAFDLDDDEQFAACWSLENLQPLWAHDNLVKAAKSAA